MDSTACGLAHCSIRLNSELRHKIYDLHVLALQKPLIAFEGAITCTLFIAYAWSASQGYFSHAWLKALRLEWIAGRPARLNSLSPRLTFSVTRSEIIGE